MDSIYKQEFIVRDLPTRSVSLYPTRAQVVRDIKDITLKPGANQIIVVGFTPSIDENSIKVEGTGPAVISDIAFQMLPNQEDFEDIYTGSDEEFSGSDTETDKEESNEAKQTRFKLEKVRGRMTALRDTEKASQERVSSAESRLRILDSYGKLPDNERGVGICEALQTYRTERAKAFEDQMQGELQLRNLTKTIGETQDEENKLVRLQVRQQLKEQWLKRKTGKAENRGKKLKMEKKKEKERIRQELRSLWPARCYTVRITLDVAGYTPTSSRRTSIGSATELARPVALGVEGAGEDSKESAADDTADLTCDLAISYVTSSAFWSPRYDLQMSTTTGSAVLCFDADLSNTTSETWSRCKVVLSTSQTTFSGLNDAIPTLVPWHVKLDKTGVSNHNPGLDGITQSREEVARKSSGPQLFGSNQQMMQQAPQRPTPASVISGGLFGTVARLPSPIVGASHQAGLFGMAAQRSVSPFSPDDDCARMPCDSDTDEEYDHAMAAARQLAFQESALGETGLTTTYDLPGLKTLACSTKTSRQRVARISLAGGTVVFSHTIVAKYKPAAYLKARIKNTSKLTLLRGPAGLTLDGAFLGRTRLPRCSPGDSFSLSLGVDPTIRVVYPKPDVKRVGGGGSLLFSKDNSGTFRRSITVTNTNSRERVGSSKSATLLVLDQVPVSEDEKLRVEIQVPRGLAVDGPSVAAGQGVASETKASGSGSISSSASTVAIKDWGRASATLKKAGEVTWDVKLHAGRTARLDLEYVVTVPVGEGATQC